jgi:hypothetical protein
MNTNAYREPNPRPARHIDTNQPQAPWGEHSRFYVSVIDGSRWRVILGPFVEHADALSHVELARNLALELDPHAHWYAFGTCQMEHGRARGSLNDWLPKAPIERANNDINVS